MVHFGQFWGLLGLFSVILVPQVQCAEKVSGGVPASPGDFPYLVGFKSTKDDDKLVRAGIIVDFNRIVMAAFIAKKHCDKCLIVAGTLARDEILNADKDDEAKGIQVRKVASILDHPCYKDGGSEYGFSYSVATLMLETPFQYVEGKVETGWFHSKFDKIFSTGDKDNIAYGPHGAEVWTAGFGATSELKEKSKDYPLVLQKMKVTIDKENTKKGDGCPNKFEICAYTDGGICTGDAGGPLLVDLKGEKQEGNQKFVAGFIYSGNCDNYARFVDLSKHVCWIISKATDEPVDKCVPDNQAVCPKDYHNGTEVEHTTQQPPPTTEAPAPPGEPEGGDGATTLSSPHIGLALFVAIIWTALRA